MKDLLELRSGNLRTRICPRLGGSITRFDFLDGDRVWPILRPCEGVPASILQTANFPLVPFVNRIRGGAFTFRGRRVTLAPNMPPDISPLHGQGWLAAWTAESAEEDALALYYRHDAGEWPWTYEARQRLKLDGEGLSLALSCRNLSADPMPCGLGQHPYYPCTPETMIDTRVTHSWTIDENVLPLEKVEAAGRYDLKDRRVCGQDLDHGFGGWGGEARMRTPGVPFETVLTSPEARFFQLYSPPAGGFYVAEPVTHANAALNAPEEEWADLGLSVLDPGEELVLDMRIEVRPSAS